MISLLFDLSGDTLLFLTLSPLLVAFRVPSLLFGTPSIFNQNKVIISYWYVAVEGIWVVSRMDMLLISVYDPQRDDCKRKLWDEISILIASFSGECVVMGDFNEVRDESERFGS